MIVSRGSVLPLGCHRAQLERQFYSWNQAGNQPNGTDNPEVYHTFIAYTTTVRKVAVFRRTTQITDPAAGAFRLQPDRHRRVRCICFVRHSDHLASSSLSNL